MKVLVAGGLGRSVDRFFVRELLDRLHKQKPISGLIAWTNEDLNEEVLGWMLLRLFNPVFVEGPPDVALLLPCGDEMLSIRQLRTLRLIAKTVIVVDEKGVAEALAGVPFNLPARA